LNEAAVINEVISLFLIILVGVYASKRKIITEEINKGLTEILLRVALPLLVISSFNFNYTNDMKANILKAILFSLAVFIITPIISYIFLLPVKNKNKKILQFINVFSIVDLWALLLWKAYMVQKVWFILQYLICFLVFLFGPMVLCYFRISYH
jgi:predicted permease